MLSPAVISARMLERIGNIIIDNTGPDDCGRMEEGLHSALGPVYHEWLRCSSTVLNLRHTAWINRDLPSVSDLPSSLPESRAWVSWCLLIGLSEYYCKTAPMIDLADAAYVGWAVLLCMAGMDAPPDIEHVCRLSFEEGYADVGDFGTDMAAVVYLGNLPSMALTDPARN